MDMSATIYSVYLDLTATPEKLVPCPVDADGVALPKVEVSYNDLHEIQRGRYLLKDTEDGAALVLHLLTAGEVWYQFTPATFGVEDILYPNSPAARRG